MPQMSPMNWMILLIIFSTILYIVMINYYYMILISKIPKITPKICKIKKSKKTKIKKIKFKKIKKIKFKKIKCKKPIKKWIFKWY